MHWYNKDGQLFDTDLKTARKEGYVPSVTEIIHEFSNSYGLDLYKARQMFFASLTLPRPEGITDEQFYDLVLEDSRVHSEKAKQFGIDVHKCFTQMYKDGGWFDKSFDDRIYKRANKVYTWVCQNKENCIVDIKTTETVDGKFRQPYDNWLFQLCGYLIGIEDKNGEFIDYSFSDNGFGGSVDYALLDTPEEINLINLIVSSNEDIPIKVYTWKPAKIDWGCKVFLKMVELYNIIKNLG